MSLSGFSIAPGFLGHKQTIQLHFNPITKITASGMSGMQSIHSAALIAQHLKVRAPAINSSRSIRTL